jgi:xanthine permease XanP
MKKPAELIFGVEERPSIGDSVVVAIQHVGAIAVNFVYPLLLARQAGLSNEAAGDMLSLGMVALAVGVIIQAIPRGPVGCHYLAPMVYASPYLAPGFHAIEVGGMPLFWGMTMVAGIATLLYSAVWDRLRTFIPPESAGLVVFLVGATIGLAALRLLHKADGTVGGPESLVTLLTLAVMIALNVWTSGRLRLFCILIGIVVGYAIALASGVMSTDRLIALASLPVLALPRLNHVSWSFDVALIVPFAVTALAVAMATTAIVTTYQRITDADWRRPDTHTIAGGIRGDGASTILAGLLGTFGVAIGPANAGVVAATSTASRVVAYPIAIILLVAAVQPAFANLLTLMPVPVMAAGLLFPAAFIMINGVQIISSRVIDARRTLVIGMGILSFLMVAIYPDTFAGAPDWLQPIVASPLVLATIIALALNLVFRIGIKRSVEMGIETVAVPVEEIENFIDLNAGKWGARRDLIARVKAVLQHAIETVIEHWDRKYPIVLKLSYDELDIEASIIYGGERLQLPDAAPSHDDVLETDWHLKLAGFLLRRQSDKIVSSVRDGVCTLTLRFRQ